MRTGPLNIHKRELIVRLRQKGYKDKEHIWIRLAEELEKPARRERAVNLSRINRNSNDNDLIVVPGKVLGSGFITKKITVAAVDISLSAAGKLAKAGCKFMLLSELMQKSAKGRKIRILG